MAVAVDLLLLNRLRRYIKKYQMHLGDVWEPVSTDALLRDVTWYYSYNIPATITAYTLRWRKRGVLYKDIALHERLRELSEVALKRYAIAHEWAHIFCKHKGDMFILWVAHEEPSGFDIFLDESKERQCAFVASFLLVRPEIIDVSKGMTKEEIALRLAVPVELVTKRWEIYDRHHL